MLPIHHTMSIYMVNLTAKQNVSCKVDSMINGKWDLYCYRMNVCKLVHIGINQNRPWQQRKHRVAWAWSVKGAPSAAWCSSTFKLEQVAGVYCTRVVTQYIVYISLGCPPNFGSSAMFAFPPLLQPHLTPCHVSTLPSLPNAVAGSEFGKVAMNEGKMSISIDFGVWVHM